MKRADILTKKITLEVLEDVFEMLDRREEEVHEIWAPTGEKVPKTRWDSTLDKRVEVIDETTGEVVMVDDWGTRKKKAEEYTPDDKAKLEAIKAVKAQLEKLI